LPLKHKGLEDKRRRVYPGEGSPAVGIEGDIASKVSVDTRLLDSVNPQTVLSWGLFLTKAPVGAGVESDKSRDGIGIEHQRERLEEVRQWNGGPWLG
jgi:hypothetical protein